MALSSTIGLWQAFSQSQKTNLDEKEIKTISQRTQARIVLDALTAQGAVINVENIVQESQRFLASRGIQVKKESLTAFAKDLAKKNQQEANRIAQTSSYSLNQNQREKLAQLPHPLANPFSPQALLSRMLHQITAPAAKTLETAAQSKDTTPEWQATIQQKLTPAIIEYSKKVYQEKIGLPEDHPIIQELEKEKKVLDQQTSTPAGRIIAQAARFRWQEETPFLPKNNLKLFLPPDYLVAKRPRFSLTSPIKTLLRPVTRFLNQSSWLSQIQISLSRFLAKGLGVKFGLGQTAVAPAAKLGLKAILAAIPEPVVSKILLVGASLLLLAKKGLKKLLEKPEAALIGGLTLFALPFSGPLGLVFKGAGLLASATGFLGGIGKWLGSFGALASKGLAGAASLAGSALGAITSLSVPASLPLIVPFAVIGLFFLALFVNTAQTSRFYESQGEYLGTLGKPTQARPANETKHLAEDVIYVLNQCQVNLVNKSSQTKMATCLENSNLANKKILINYFNSSINNFGSLQCVGFVRGVMAALSRDPGSPGKNANGYLTYPVPAPIYTRLTNTQNAQIGDLGVIKGNQGHVVVVVDVNPDGLVRIAEAWGTENGRLEVETDYNPVYFDAILRPK